MDLVRPYPFVGDLPLLMDTRNWEWERLESKKCGKTDFFKGIDELGNAWLTKMRGSFYGYRELVFERLVQRAGWLCQSSSFAILEGGSLPMQANPAPEPIQLVTRLLLEHGPGDCEANCPIGPLRGELDQLDGDPLELFAASSLEDALNHARKDILAPLLGGNEPAGCLTTVDHRVFLIDGELMFATRPDDVRITEWWDRPDGSPWRAGRRLTRDVCAAVGSLSDDELDALLETPDNLNLDLNWPIRPLLFSARDYGRDFAFREHVENTL